MREPITMLDALTTALRLAEEANIAGRVVRGAPISQPGPCLSLHYERGQAEARMAVSYRPTLTGLALDIQVSWTPYAAVLHAEVADLACLIETVLSRETIALEKP